MESYDGGALVFLRVTLPDRAGDLQRASASGALVAELGDNYSKYHAFLVEEYDKVGGGKDVPPSDPLEVPGFLERAARIDDLASTEVALRQFRAIRMGLDLSKSVGGVFPGPLLDRRGRPVSAEDLDGSGPLADIP